MNLDEVITTNFVSINGKYRSNWHINHWTWAITLTGESGRPGQMVMMQNTAGLL